MLSLLFLIMAAMHVIILIWAVSLCRQTRSPVAVMAMLPLLMLWYDCLIIGVGRWLGPGELLYMLSMPRYWAHWVLTPMWIIAAGGLMRHAGVRWVRPRPVMAAFCVLAVAMVALEVPLFWTLEVHPACYLDTVRYAQSIAANAVCSPDQALVRGAGPPIPAIVTNLVLMIAGIALWRTLGWPYLALGAVGMFLAAALPVSIVGPAVGNMGEIVLAIAVLLTVSRVLPVQPAHVTQRNDPRYA
jgi:hypothetical protein